MLKQGLLILLGLTVFVGFIYGSLLVVAHVQDQLTVAIAQSLTDH